MKNPHKRILGKWKSADPAIISYATFGSDGKVYWGIDDFQVCGTYRLVDDGTLETQGSPFEPPTKIFDPTEILRVTTARIEWRDEQLVLKAMDGSRSQSFARR